MARSEDLTSDAPPSAASSDDAAAAEQQLAAFWNVGLQDTPQADEPFVATYLEEGTTVGRYRLGKVIGVGGQGVVYRGEHFALGYPVAIKVLHGVGASELRRARIKREARIGAQLRHPNIVAVLDAGELEGGNPYVVMEHVAGVSLAEVIGEQPLGPAAVVELGQQLLSALATLHEHAIVHRDIKPDNVMLRYEVDGCVTAKLLDFGISKVDDTTFGGRLTRTGTLVGTPHYMSPEHVLGETLDVRSDLYAVAAVLYECIAGVPPHDAPTTGAVLARIATRPADPLLTAAPLCPIALAAVVDRGLLRDREQRWSHPLAMSEALRRTAQRATLARGADAWVGCLPPVVETGRASHPILDAAPVVLEPTPHFTRTVSSLRKYVPRPRMLLAAGGASSLGVAALAALLIGASTSDAAPVDMTARRVDVVFREATATLDLGPPIPLSPPPQVASAAPPPALPIAAVETPLVRAPRARAATAGTGDVQERSVDELERSARSAFVRGDRRRSLALYSRLVTEVPRRASAWRGLGLVAAANGDARTARRAFERYLRLAPAATDRAWVERELTRLR